MLIIVSGESGSDTPLKRETETETETETEDIRGRRPGQVTCTTYTTNRGRLGTVTKVKGSNKTNK